MDFWSFHFLWCLFFDMKVFCSMSYGVSDKILMEIPNIEEKYGAVSETWSLIRSQFDSIVTKSKWYFDYMFSHRYLSLSSHAVCTENALESWHHKTLWLYFSIKKYTEESCGWVRPTIIVRQLKSQNRLIEK